MPIKKIMLLITYASLLSAYNVTAATGDSPSATSGFIFSPIAHAHTASLLDFIASYPSLTQEAQKSIYMDVVQALTKDNSDTKLRIKQAAILAVPNSSLRDTTVAQQHLKALREDHTLSESSMNLVKLLYTFTLDYNQASQKLRVTTKNVSALKQRNRALGQKLNDLKNIEKTMIERNTKSK